MATIGDLTLDTLDMLYGSGQAERPVEDTLTTNVSSTTDVTWQFDTSALWKRGDRAERWHGDGTAGEMVVMAEDHPSGSDVTVRRGQIQTTPATHSLGSVFLKNPPYPLIKVQRAIQQVVDLDLSPDIFYRSTRSVTPVTTTHYYELADEDFDVEMMYQFDLNATTNKNPFPSGWWEVVTDVDTSMVTSGRILRLYRWYSDTDDIYYTARSKYMFTDLANIPAEVADIVTWGAVARILATSAPSKRIDPARSSALAQGEEANQLYTDAEYYRAQFERMKGMYRRRLIADKRLRAGWRRPSSMIIRR
jgi:hypothetical protein